MVIEDFSQQKPDKNEPRLAPVADRVLSVMVDLALFWPLFSLVLSGLLRKLQYRYYSAPDSAEFWVLVALTFVGYSFLMIFTQGVFWSVVGATPGQMFFQLRVLRSKDRGYLSLYAGWLRAFLFWIQCLLFGLPFLEVFSHSGRRALHDRATDAEVFTLKQAGAAPPNALEIRVMRGFFTLCLAVALVWGMALSTHYYRKVASGAYKEAELLQEDYLCEKIPSHEEGGRLDPAIAMYKTGALSAECLMNEIDFAFWKGENPDQAWASLAMAVLNEHDVSTREAYLDQVCEKSEKSLACHLAEWWRNDSPLLGRGSNSWTRSVLAIERSEKHHEVAIWQKELSALPRDFDLSEYIESERIKLLWNQNKSELARGGYEVLFDHLSESTQRDLASQLCFSEVTSECSVKSFRFCEDLEGAMAEGTSESLKPEWLVALAEEKSCRKVGESGLLQLVGTIDPESDWAQLLLAIVPESGWSETKRVSELRKLAFAPGESSLLKSRAFVELLRQSSDPSDLEKGQAVLARKDIPFQVEIQSLYMTTAKKMGFEKQERLPASEAPQ